MRLLEPTAQIWMKIDPYYQRQKCRPMNLVSENIRFMWIVAGIPLGIKRQISVKRRWGLSMTAIFGDLGGYVFENFRDTASNIICKWLQNEWPWVAIWWQNAFSASTSWISVWMSEIVQLLRFCGVLCIARSVSQPIGRHAQLTRCFSVVAELLVITFSCLLYWVLWGLVFCW